MEFSTEPSRLKMKLPISRHGMWTLLACSGLLAIFAISSYRAVLTKNATIDEPTLAMSGWLELCQGDFHVETVTPPLCKMWAALPNFSVRPRLMETSPVWKTPFFDPAAEVEWSMRVLYQTPGFDGDAFLNRSRAMMLLIGVVLGAMIAFWSYRLGGTVAAVTAATLFCFDPNFLGHAPVVKSDVGLSAVLLALAFSIWCLGRRATIMNLLATGLACGIAINVKFSGVIVGPILAATMLARASMTVPWPFLGKTLETRSAKIFAGAITGVIAILCCFIVTWASYGFRYRVSASPTMQMDMAAIYRSDLLVQTGVDLGRPPTAAEIAAHSPGAVARFVRWADRRHLLPQAMLAGLLHQHTCSMSWPAFLNGVRDDTGSWKYFPLATLYKSPLATLLAYAIAVVVFAVAAIRRARYSTGSSGDCVKDMAHSNAILWASSCLLIPLCVFGAAVITAHINIGLRNALPAFPFMQIGVGCAAAIVWRWRSRAVSIAVFVVGIGLAIESVSAWPNYIAFFNVAVGGEQGGFRHLSDSNLDWGQDFKLLADWQRQHPDVPLFAKFFYSVDPRYYGVSYHPLFARVGKGGIAEYASDIPLGHCVIAVSATHLQGLYISREEEQICQKLRQTRPIAVLGGTIYLFEHQPSKSP